MTKPIPELDLEDVTGGASRNSAVSSKANPEVLSTIKSLTTSLEDLKNKSNQPNPMMTMLPMIMMMKKR